VEGVINDRLNTNPKDHCEINNMLKLGTLYLIPVTLGEDNITKVLPPDVVSIAQQLDTFVVESEKSARHFFKHH